MNKYFLPALPSSRQKFQSETLLKCQTDNVNGAFEYIAEVKRLLQESKGRTVLKKLENAALVVLAGQSSNFLKEDLLSIVGFDSFFKPDPEL